MRASVIVIAFWLGLGGMAFGQVRVTSTAELERALRSARGGERIELAPGRYEPLVLSGRRSNPVTWSSPVTVTSADARNPAMLTALDLRFVDNLTLANLAFTYRFAPGDLQRAKPFMLRDVNRITIRGSQFKGDTAAGTGTASDGFATGTGLDVTDADALSIKDNRFELWHRAAVFNRVKGLTVSGNAVSRMRSEGFNFIAVTEAVIERNHFHDFQTSLATGDHPDMIQFWTNQTKTPSVNVVIRNNILDAGGGNWTQSIFMRNEEVDSGRAGQEMFYRNIEITGNVIRNAHSHGITVGETDGLAIANNTLIQSVEAPRQRHVTTPGINIAPRSINVRVTNNIAPRYSAFSSDWTVASNLSIQRLSPRQPDFYNAVFVDALAPGLVPLAKLELHPEAPIAYRDAGSPLLRFNDRPKSTRVIISSRPVRPGRGSEQRLTVSAAYGPSGRVSLANARAVWTVGEGAALTGLEVTHRFAGPGLHQPRVKVTWPDGQEAEADRTILVE